MTGNLSQRKTSPLWNNKAIFLKRQKTFTEMKQIKNKFNC